jgi:hypothetical protein
MYNVKESSRQFHVLGMNKLMVKKSENRTVVLLFLSMMVSGCITNNYDKYFSDSERDRSIKSVHGNAPVILKTVTTEEDVLQLMEDGYLAVGTSSFTGRYCPFSCAVDTAEKHGAALVLLDVRFKEKRQYTSIMYLPSYSTTRHSGYISASAYGSGGYAYGTGTYSGTSTTTTMNAVPVQREMSIYNHDAMFFKKVDYSGRYGIVWDIPKRLPTDKVDSPIGVHVLAVVHGTKAEKDGIKRGQVVKSINGTPIMTRKDISQFIADESTIREVEVSDEE